MPQTPDDLSPVKRALVELRELRARLDAVEAARREPLAVIGIGCRVPGADTPEAFFDMLRAGTDAIREVPASRWDADAFYDPDPETPGRMATRWGGFLDGIDLFDPQLFGVSPREAMTMDPQQRLLLEVSWEALEHAGQAPDRLRGSRTGVFVGIGTNDYAVLQLQRSAVATIDAYLATGSVSHSVASGRLAYVFGFQGPTVSVDTACSSSLVAVHLACQSLRLGECRMALAGGVNVILAPELTISLSKAHMMAPDGRCKTFDAAADGFVRGEGCGLVVLKRLSDAVADGDRVLAIIRGTAINQDGRSNGLTAPNGPSQEAVLRDALANAGVEAGQVGYVETHGTGTALGDPIELQALGAVFGPGRPAGSPLLVGSVKTNVGHLESVAGVAGLIKVVLALQHAEIPPHLHFRTPNPHVAWNELPVAVTSGKQPWPSIGGTRIGGVSSFGFSGTNAHVILEQAPAGAAAAEAADRPRHVLVVSARTDAALRATAGSWAGRLAADTQLEVGDVCHTAAVGRAALAERAAVVVDSRDAARTALERLGRGESVDGARRGRVEGSERPRLAFLFTGQGSQYPDMGRQLFETEPVFRQAIEECEAILAGVGRPIVPVLFPPASGDRRIHETQWTQPALVALEYALARLWRSWGIEPAAVLGHSAGEYAAACAAEVLSLPDALRLIAERGRLMHEAPGHGAMAAIFAAEDRVRTWIGVDADAVSVAAANAPENTVVSGAAEAVARVVARAVAQGARTQPLNVSHAFHSPLMEPVLDEFRRAAARVISTRGTLPLVSNVTGQVMTEAPDADYWVRHLRGTVRFADGVRALVDGGWSVFLEIGPAPTLTSLGRQTAGGGRALWTASLREGREPCQQVLEAVADLFVNGVEIDWPAFDRGRRRRKVALPTYPFERKRYWFEEPRATVPAAAGEEPAAAPAAAVDALPGPTEAQRFTAQLIAAFPDERRELLLAFVRGHVADVLQLDRAEPLDRARGLMDLGLDSLMAVELRTRLEAGLQLERPLPATLILDHPHLDAIVTYLAGELVSPATAGAAVVAQGPGLTALSADAVGELSEEEAEELLLRRLEGLQESV